MEINSIFILNIIIILVVIITVIITSIIILSTIDSRECDSEIHIPIDMQYTVKAVLHREPLTYMNDIITKIPKIIIQTNERSEIPPGMFDATTSILDHNPEYLYLYYDDTAAREYIVNNYPDRVVKAYDKLIPGAYKADLFRYCILYHMGGVYIDMGMVSKCPLRNIIKSDDVFVSPEDNGGFGIYNAFICCVPKHDIIANAIDICVDNIERSNYGISSLDVTGPNVFSKAFRSALSKDTNWIPIPDKTYGPGIRTIRHHKYDLYSYDKHRKCKLITLEGNIHDGKIFVFVTRHPTYRAESKWYNTTPHYGILWDNHKVYRELDNNSI